MKLSVVCNEEIQVRDITTHRNLTEKCATLTMNDISLVEKCTPKRGPLMVKMIAIQRRCFRTLPERLSRSHVSLTKTMEVVCWWDMIYFLKVDPSTKCIKIKFPGCRVLRKMLPT